MTTAPRITSLDHQLWALQRTQLWAQCTPVLTNALPCDTHHPAAKQRSQAEGKWSQWPHHLLPHLAEPPPYTSIQTPAVGEGRRGTQPTQSLLQCPGPYGLSPPPRCARDSVTLVWSTPTPHQKHPHHIS